MRAPDPIIPRNKEIPLQLQVLQQIRETIAQSIDPSSSLLQSSDRSLFSKYSSDPIGFCENELGNEYTEDIQSLMLSFRDNPFTIGKSGNAVGKTHGIASLAVWAYKCHDDSQIYTFAAPPEDNLKRLIWGEISRICIKHPALFANDKISLEGMRISRLSNPNSFITGVTIPATGSPEQRMARFSGKHAPYLAFFGDEGDAIPSEIYLAIDGCMSGGDAHALITFNPRQRIGPIWDMEAQSLARIIQLSALNHPNVISGLSLMPGAVSQETITRRINEWSAPLQAGEIPSAGSGLYFQIPEHLIGKIAKSRAGVEYPPLPGGWRRIIDPAFSYMVLGEYPAQAANQLISREWVEAAAARWRLYNNRYGPNAIRNLPAGIRNPVQGLDVGELGEDKSVSTLRYGSYVAPQAVWGKADPLQTAQRAGAIYQSSNANRAVIDANGVGAGVAPIMQTFGCQAYGCKVQSSPTHDSPSGEFFSIRDQGWWDMAQWLKLDATAMIPDDPMLMEELCAPMVFKTQRGKVKISPNDVIYEFLSPKRSPDRATSLMLTFIDSPEDETGSFKQTNYAY